MQLAKDILNKAADLIEEKGHCKERFKDDDGSMCMMYAVTAATPRFNSWNQANGVGDTLWEAVYDEIGHDNLVSIWNDDPERQPYEVINALRFAAKRIEDTDAGS